MRDKALLFDDARTGFVMYGVAGRTWVALGDPVGPEAARRDLVRRFLARCGRLRAGGAIFYQVGKESLHHYADFGLTFVKLGEEARVPLAGFDLEGALAQALPQRGAQGGTRGRSASACSTREEVAAALAELRAVSDDWLARRGVVREGLLARASFDEEYVRRFPAAVIEEEGRIVAFATLWPGPGSCELSVDLMRHLETAPKIRDGGALRAADAVGRRAGLQVVQPRAWRRSRASRPRRSRRCGRGSAGSSTGAASPSTTSRACARSRRSSTPSGSRAI